MGELVYMCRGYSVGRVRVQDIEQNVVFIAYDQHEIQLACFYLPNIEGRLSLEDAHKLVVHFGHWPQLEFTADQKIAYVAVPVRELHEDGLSRMREMIAHLTGAPVYRICLSADGFDRQMSRLLDALHSPTCIPGMELERGTQNVA